MIQKTGSFAVDLVRLAFDHGFVVLLSKNWQFCRWPCASGLWQWFCCIVIQKLEVLSPAFGHGFVKLLSKNWQFCHWLCAVVPLAFGHGFVVLLSKNWQFCRQPLAMVLLCYYPKTGSFATGFVLLAFRHGFVVFAIHKLAVLPPAFGHGFVMLLSKNWHTRDY